MDFLLIFLLVLSIVILVILGEDRKYDNKTSLKFEGFIIGGNSAIISTFPHAVCLFKYPIYQFMCGASVLNQGILLTAAHCAEDVNRNTFYEAYAGHENLLHTTIIRKVSNTIVHENYDPVTTHNDIALMFIGKATFPLGAESKIKRVIIRKDFPPTDEAEVSGWGYISDATNEISETLKSTKQRVIPLDDCELYLVWLPGMMCGTNSIDNRPSSGDSGGGLMIAGSGQLIGVVSFTTRDDPNIIFYTNISEYYDWVEKSAVGWLTEICNWG